MKMLMSSTLVLTALSLAASSTAHAGGVGLLGTGGMHAERVYFYDADDNQFLQTQYSPNFGGGITLMLGDRDDRLVGHMRFYYQADAAPYSDVFELGGVPDGFEGDVAYVATRGCVEVEGKIACPEEDAYVNGRRNIGMAAVGLQWTLFGDPTGFAVNLLTNIGHIKHHQKSD